MLTASRAAAAASAVGGLLSGLFVFQLKAGAARQTARSYYGGIGPTKHRWQHAALNFEHSKHFSTSSMPALILCMIRHENKGALHCIRDTRPPGHPPHHLSTGSAQPHQGAAWFRQGSLQQLIHSHSSIGCTHDMQAYSVLANLQESNPPTSHRRRIHARACSFATALTATMSVPTCDRSHGIT